MKRFLIAGLLVSSSASATMYSGNDIYNKMTSESSTDRVLVLGYIAGIYDAMEGVAFCPKNGVTLGQMNDIVLKKLRAMPESRHLPADNFVFVSLSEAFPCPKKKAT